MSVFFTSDLHLDHTNCAVKHRGFNSVEEHNDFIIDRINSVVSKRDKLFIAGDIGHNTSVKALRYFDRLNCGNLHLIMGNHDQCHIEEYAKIFNKISGIITYKGFWVTHAPMHPAELRGRLNIHGHVHGHKLPDGRYVNINTDVNDYLPLSFDSIMADRMAANGLLEWKEKYGS